MKVGWIHDDPGYVGGAELTMGEFMAAIPEDFEASDDLESCEYAIVGNCTQYGADLIPKLLGKKVIRYFNDMDPHGEPNLRRWFLNHADCVFTSPEHHRRFPWRTGKPELVVPPAIDLKAFNPPRQTKRNTKCEGAVAIGAWHNPGKGQQALSEWADEHGPVDVYGEGRYVPNGRNLEPKGPLEPEKVAQTLWGYETFVHLPTAFEPFGRAVVEAWAAGCKIIVNKLVGARHFIEEDPEALERAAEDFWIVVMT